MPSIEMSFTACNWSSNDATSASDSCFLNMALMVLDKVFTVRGRAVLRL